MSKIFDHFGLIFGCATLFWLSNQHSLPSPALFDNQDKLQHLSAYLGLAILCWRSFRHFIMHPIILAIVGLTFCSLYGISDEWHQSFVPGREASVADWIADTLGAAIANLLLLKYAFNTTNQTAW